MSDEIVDACHLCGLPATCVRLVRLTWVGDYGPNGKVPQVAVAKRQKTNDAILCVECIRGIKRIAFSDIEEQEFYPVDPVFCHCCDKTTGDCKCRHNPDGSVEIPF
jgi:hypothetical protein